MKKYLLLFLCLTSIQAFGSTFRSQTNQLNCCVDWCTGWVVEGDYLYWQPLRSNLAYVASVDSIISPPSVGNDSKITSVCPDWESGYRVALSKIWGSCGFDTTVQYTHLCGKTKDETIREVGQDLFPMRLDPAGQTPTDLQDNVDFVTGEYKLDYHVGDILAGYSFCIDCSNLVIRPFWGVKIAFIEEEFASEFTITPSTPETMLQKTDMNLYGITVGCENSWGFCRDLFGIFFKGSIAVMYADIDRKYTRFLSDTGAPIFTVRSSTCNVVPEFELSTGIWGSIWSNDCFCIDVQVGYDFQGWLIQDFLYILDGTGADLVADVRFVLPDYDPDARLGLQGLFAKVSVAF